MKNKWKSRIIGRGDESPDQLVANPDNWRIHSKLQQDTMSSILDDVGWVQDVIVNKRTGNMIDGHMRVLLAMRKKEKSVPVVYVDLDPDEEKKILAFFDPIGAMAGKDQEVLDNLLADVQMSDDFVASVFGDGKESKEKPTLKQIDTKTPPKMSWVLIGIPTVRFGEIQEAIDQIAAIEETVVETTVNDGD